MPMLDIIVKSLIRLNSVILVPIKSKKCINFGV